MLNALKLCNFVGFETHLLKKTNLKTERVTTPKQYSPGAIQTAKSERKI